MSRYLFNVSKDGDSIASLDGLCQCSATFTPHHVLPMVSEPPVFLYPVLTPGTTEQSLATSCLRLLPTHSRTLASSPDPLSVPSCGTQRGGPQRLGRSGADQGRPARPQRRRPPGPAARECSAPSLPQQPRAHGGTESSDGPRAGPGHAASGTRPGPPSPRGQRGPGARRCPSGEAAANRAPQRQAREAPRAQRSPLT